MRLVIGVALIGWVGATLLLAELPSFSRPSLAERLRPYASGSTIPARRDVLSVESLRDVIRPLALTVGDRLAALAGVVEGSAARLERAHTGVDLPEFRMRQLGAAVAATGLTALVVAGTAPHPAAGLVLLVSAPALAFLVLEQRLARQSRAWQQALFLELPVVSEQLAMLLGAGYSLGSAMNRLAERGRGACARDLQVVVARLRQGLSETEALREWAAGARVESVDRLVAVLALERESGDLSRLLEAEARAIRRDAQRELIAVMERRDQQVWVPVTVAALVPGTVFLAIPFIEALRLFAGT